MSTRTEVRRLAVDKILVPPDRLRDLEEDKAQSIAASIAIDGQLQPIAVYHSNRSARPYTLIFGLHRYRAIEILGAAEIDVIIRTADEAGRLEVAENLFRNDLNELDRAAFAKRWAELVEIKIGRPKKGKSATHGHLFDGHVVSDREAERLGFTGRTGRRLRQIADKLHPELKALLRGTPYAQNQSMLLKLASMPDAKQRGIVAGMRSGGDLLEVLALDKPEKPKLDRQAKARADFNAAWKVMDAESRQKALADIGLDTAA